MYNRKLKSRTILPQPNIPDYITLRDYQIRAIEAWQNASCKGIFEMATGTGKTITALSAAVGLFKQHDRVILVIICPYKHLVEQWAKEARQFGFRPICVAESKLNWEAELAAQLRAYHKKYINIVTIIATNRSLQMGTFPELIHNYWPDVLLIADEAHYVGAPTLLAALPKQAPWRLGLSATPVRQYDEDGTEAILEYFGDIVFRLPLEEAIGTFLTPYFYYPIPVEMTDDEFAEFCKLTNKLRCQIHWDNQPLSDRAQKIAIARARVLNNSITKLEWLRGNIEDYAKIKYALFYAGDQIFDDVRSLLGLEKHIRIHEFTHRQSSNNERTKILDRFTRGDLQALVAMKCLDEGVDIPPARTAYFLASSSNPREFVQRRGRVLRLSEGKEFATLFDLISVPPMEFIKQGELNPEYNAVRAAVKREYRRVKEFASMAINHYRSLDKIMPFGRLDKVVHDSISRRLPDITSQLILFLIPDIEWNEITERNLCDKSSHIYQLKFDNTHRQTTITKA